MKSQLLPAVVETAVKPKPTKREVIDALALLHISAVKTENAKILERRKVLSEQIEVGLKKILHRRGISKLHVSASKHYYSGKADASLNIAFRGDDLTEPLKAAIREHEESREKCVPSFADARATVAKRMAGIAPHDERVAALLADTDSRAALEAMLTTLGK